MTHVSPTPLWLIFMMPFIAIIVSVAALTTYLSNRNTHQVVDEAVQQLLDETGERILLQTESYLAAPICINRNTQNILQHRLLNLDDREALSHYFWEVTQRYPSVSSIYLGNPEGGLALGGREGAEGSLYIMSTDNFEAGELSKFATDAAGNPTEVIFTLPEFDARVRPWYEGAVETGDLFWTAPYVLSTGQDLAIASSLPIYDEAEELQAVISVDIFISQLSDYLQNLSIGKTGQAYILESSGLLVATSTSAPTFVSDPQNQWRRLAATESADPIIAASAQKIQTEWREDKQSTMMAWQGETYYVEVLPMQQTKGIDWLVVLVIPQSDFLAPIEAQNRVNAALTILAVGLASGAGVLLALRVTRPIRRLAGVADALAGGDWSQDIPLGGGREIGALASAFDAMRGQLRETIARLEERVQERTQELQAHEAQFRGIVEDQTELICRFKSDYTLSFVNGAYCRYYEKTAQELIGQSFMPHIPAADQTKLRAGLGALTPANPVMMIQHTVIKANGENRWVEWVNRAFFDEAGGLREFQSVGRDITDHKNYEDLLKQALERETELNQLKSRIISTVSHEFRTPISIISTSSELISHYGERMDSARKVIHFEQIQTQIKRMVSLLEDVLTVNQAELGKLEFKPAPMDLEAFFRMVIGEIQSISPPTIQFEFETLGECHTVHADEKLLRLILSNLISNAAKYSPPQGHIRVNLNCQDTQLMFRIQDDGIGIPAAVQPLVFEAFFRAENVNTIQGTGLGLAIVKQCLEEYGGEITLESEEGKGTTFTVTLPHSAIPVGDWRG